MRSPTEGPARTRQFCTVRLGSDWFGIALDRVQEVLQPQEMTAVPLAPQVVRGLINLRGQIVTAVDLRRALDLPEAGVDSRPEPMNVVVRSESGAVSLLVDGVGDVLDVPEELFEPPPDTVPAAARDRLDGTYKLEQRLLFAVNVDRALASGSTA